MWFKIFGRRENCIKIKCPSCSARRKVPIETIKGMPRFQKDGEWCWRMGCHKCYNKIILSKENIPKDIYPILVLSSRGEIKY